MNNILVGRVYSLKMNKTVIIFVKKIFKSSLYSFLLFKSIKIYAHDYFNFCKKNDFVVVIKSKPISKKKFWKVIKIL